MAKVRLEPWAFLFAQPRSFHSFEMGKTKYRRVKLILIGTDMGPIIAAHHCSKWHPKFFFGDVPMAWWLRHLRLVPPSKMLSL